MDANENNVNGCRIRTYTDSVLADLAENVRDNFSIRDIKMNTVKSKIDEYNYHAICTSVIITTDKQMFLGIGNSELCDGDGYKLDREDMNKLVDDVQCLAMIDAANNYAKSMNTQIDYINIDAINITPSVLKATLLGNDVKDKK